jgi:hypothetical protein
MTLPIDQRPATSKAEATKETPLLKRSSKSGIVERIQNVILRRKNYEDTESLIKTDNNYGTFP